jgi:hypothetical protein
MAAPSITHHANIVVSPEAAAQTAASFGTMMLLHEHAVGAERVAGPFTSAADVVTAGHASGSVPHLWIQRALAQQPLRSKQFYIGRLDSGDADLIEGYEAIEAEDPAVGYGLTLSSRSETDILDFRTLLSTRKRIGIAQSNAASLLVNNGMYWTASFGGTPTDGTYRLIFTGFGLVSPVNVDVVRSTTPATNAALATELGVQLTTAAGGSLSGELVTASVDVDGTDVTFRTANGLVGTVTVTDPESPDGLSVTLDDADLGSQLFIEEDDRCALLYYHDDAVYADAAFMARVLMQYDQDTRKGKSAYHKGTGLTPSQLTEAQATALRAVNCSYLAPVAMSSGVQSDAFFYRGRFGSGRRIDVTITYDVLQSRLEEGWISLQLASEFGLDFDGAGLNAVDAMLTRVLGNMVRARHFTPTIIPDDEEDGGRLTPFIDLPTPDQISAANRTDGLLPLGRGVAYTTQKLERLEFNLFAKQ